MMAHPDEGALQALLDGELDLDEMLRVETHAAACDDCGIQLNELRVASATLSTALALLDRGSVAEPLPAATLSPPPSTRRPPVWGAAPLRRAAVLLLTFAAAASATIPGSPIRRWIGERLAPRPVAVVAEPEIEQPVPTLAVGAPPESGVSIQPAAGRLRFLLSGATPELQVRVLLTDSPRGGVFAIGDGSSARFRTAQGTIEVFDAGGGEIRVEIPRSVQSASLVVDGRSYLVKDGDQLRLEVPARDSSAAELLFQIDP
jgi:Putative zinc-finger